MSKRQRRFISVFISICSAGVFIGFASGIEWGTDTCGWLSGLTLMIAGTVSALS